MEKGTTTPSIILACRIPMDSGALQATVHGVSESDTTEQVTLRTGCFIFFNSG